MKIHYRPRAAGEALAHRTAHMRRLLASDRARRSVKRDRKVSRGQTLIIFALTFTILIGFLGLAIDTIRLYDIYARMQRAAEAGALAGVIYMPTNYTTNLTSAPGDNAVCRALQEVYKNSFGPNCATPSQTPSTPCPSQVSSAEIAVCQVYDSTNAVKPYDLQVTVTENVNVLFISALNVGPLRISATATAEYIPPVQIASDPGTAGGTNSWGTFGECGNAGTGASAACTGTGVRNFAGNINGPGELKEQGDPLVSCEEGPSNLTSDPAANVAGTVYPTTYTGLPTNHQQDSRYNTPGVQPAACTNPDTNNVFTGVAYIASDGTKPVRPGYAFYVNMEKATSNTNLWVWNLPFNPSKPPSCNGRQSTGQSSYDIFYEYNCKGANGSPYPYYPGNNPNTGPYEVCNGQDPYTCTDPNLLFSITYSVYDISLANPTAGTLIGWMQAFPLVPSNICSGGQLLQEGSPGLAVTQACVNPLCVAQWCPLATNERGSDNNTNPWTNLVLQAGHDYRVMVVTSDYGTPTDPHMGWGGHSFSMKLCPTSGVSQSSVQTCATTQNASISGWNMSDVLFTFPGNGGSLAQTTEYPLGVVQSNYSGRTIDVSLYDPGDLIGSAKGVSIYGAVPNLNLPGTPDPCAETAAQLQAAGYDPAINGASFKFATGTRTTLFNGNIPAIEPTANDDLIYNGLWKDEQITMPASYKDTAWTLCAQAPQLNDSDVLAIKVLALGQSPVHLVQ